SLVAAVAIEPGREKILPEGTRGRNRALAKLMPMQKGDFVGILRTMAGLPVTIRLLDPPLHEFLPHTEEEIVDLAAKLGVPAERLRAKRNALHEVNAVLGHAGGRLGITSPESYETPARQIMEA